MVITSENEKLKIFLIVLFPITMILLSLYLPFSGVKSNLGSIKGGYMDWVGFWVARGVFSIPSAGFLVITCLCVLKKLKMLATIIWTAIWIIMCLPLTWIIAAIFDRFVYLGVELYL